MENKMNLQESIRNDLKKISETNEWDDKETDGKFTQEQVEQWLGSDLSRKGVIELITDVANGDYPVEMLKSDISGYDFE